MARRFDAERNRRTGIVEIAKVLDVVPVTAGWIECTCALGMSWDGIGPQRMVRLQPLNARYRLTVPSDAVIVDRVLPRPKGVVGCVESPNQIAVGSIEAEFELSHLVRVALFAPRILACDDRNIGMFMARNNPF